MPNDGRNRTSARPSCSSCASWTGRTGSSPGRRSSSSSPSREPGGAAEVGGARGVAVRRAVRGARPPPPRTDAATQRRRHARASSPSLGGGGRSARPIGAAAAPDRARAQHAGGARSRRCARPPRARCRTCRRRTVPIVAITGTNGKSTTTRLLAHILASAGRRVGMTNSDGIYVDGTLVEAGDWTGFGGAAACSPSRASTPRCSRRPAAGSCCAASATTRNDVAVVTNVSPDHLGLQRHRHPRRAGGDEGRDRARSRSGTAGSS